MLQSTAAAYRYLAKVIKTRGLRPTTDDEVFDKTRQMVCVYERGADRYSVVVVVSGEFGTIGR